MWIMTEAQLERRLAAILAADVAGYSRRMGADEVGTLAALKRIGARSLIRQSLPIGAASSRPPATVYWSSSRASSCRI
jgi:hypothetical protein